MAHTCLGTQFPFPSPNIQLTERCSAAATAAGSRFLSFMVSMVRSTFWQPSNHGGGSPSGRRQRRPIEFELGHKFHATALKRSNRTARRSRSGRSFTRYGSWMVTPSSPFRASSIGQSVIGVDANQIRIEGSVVDFGKRNAVGNYRLTEPIIPIIHDMRRVQQ